jgi:hypothetical protein
MATMHTIKWLVVNFFSQLLDLFSKKHINCNNFLLVKIKNYFLKNVVFKKIITLIKCRTFYWFFVKKSLSKEGHWLSFVLLLWEFWIRIQTRQKKFISNTSIIIFLLTFSAIMLLFSSYNLAWKSTTMCMLCKIIGTSVLRL